MSLHRLKPRFQALLRPWARRIERLGGTANQVTTATALTSVGVGWLLATVGRDRPVLFLLLPPWLFARMALNAIDGILAREHGQRTRLGGYLNELADAVADAATILPFAVVPPFSPAAVALVAVLASWTELAGVLGHPAGVGRRYEGPMGKSDRALVFGGAAAWLGATGRLPDAARGLPWVVAALLLVTMGRRVARGAFPTGSRW